MFYLEQQHRPLYNNILLSNKKHYFMCCIICFSRPQFNWQIEEKDTCRHVFMSNVKKLQCKTIRNHVKSIVSPQFEKIIIKKILMMYHFLAEQSRNYGSISRYNIIYCNVKGMQIDNGLIFCSKYVYFEAKFHTNKWLLGYYMH